MHPDPSADAISCLIAVFDGAIHSMEWKDALWDRYVMAAPRPRTPSEQQHSAGFERGTEPGARHQSEDGREVAKAAFDRGSEDRAEGAGLDRSQRGMRCSPLVGQDLAVSKLLSGPLGRVA